MTVGPPGERGTFSTVLVGGHESAHGADLAPLLDTLPRAVATPPGRALHSAVGRLLAETDGSILVLPMTWGRDRRMVADTARTLSWLATHDGAGRLAQCAPFGTPDHLVSWLRRAADQTARHRPGAGVILAAASSDPFDDADLHRAAHLVRSHGADVLVEVALLAGPTDLDAAVGRAGLLGCREVVVVPAGFARDAPAGLPHGAASFYGPLLSERAVLDVVRQRLAAAQHHLAEGHDGIASGLEAEHGHGYAHSHAGDETHEHAHHHGHSHPHAHPSATADRATHDEALASPH